MFVEALLRVLGEEIRAEEFWSWLAQPGIIEPLQGRLDETVGFFSGNRLQFELFSAGGEVAQVLQGSGAGFLASRSSSYDPAIPLQAHFS